jgi:hypothetical protein
MIKTVAVAVGNVRSCRAAKLTFMNITRCFGRARQPSSFHSDVLKRKPGVLDKVGQLDIAQGDDEHSKRSRALGEKLKQGLTKGKTRTVMNSASQGITDSISEHIRDMLTVALDPPRIRGIFKGIRNASKAVEVVDVKTNQGVTHVTAYWHSPALATFLKGVYRKLGEEEAVKYTTMVVDSVDSAFSVNEGAFRSYLIKKMDFKRVPRIHFRSAGPENMKELGRHKSKSRAWGVVGGPTGDFVGHSEQEEEDEGANSDVAESEGESNSGSSEFEEEEEAKSKAGGRRRTPFGNNTGRPRR